MLVPINQVGARWIQPFERAKFPDGFTMNPADLMKSREGRLSLVDVLSEGEYEVFNLNVPEGTARQNAKGGPGVPRSRELPVSAEKRWSIGIVDEGPPEPAVDHRKFNLSLTRNEFLAQVERGHDRSSPAQRDEAREIDGPVCWKGMASVAAEASRLTGKRACGRYSRTEDVCLVEAGKLRAFHRALRRFAPEQASTRTQGYCRAGRGGRITRSTTSAEQPLSVCMKLSQRYETRRFARATAKRRRPSTLPSFRSWHCSGLDMIAGVFQTKR